MIAFCEKAKIDVEVALKKLKQSLKWYQRTPSRLSNGRRVIHGYNAALDMIIEELKGLDNG